MSAGPKLRFAPSPTGKLHIGNAQTAFANWLYAKKLNGKMIIRVDDTDQKRTVEGALESVLADLKWLGIDHNDELVYQSNRFDIYKNIADSLIKSGKLYECFCTSAELEEQRAFQMKMGKPPRYPGTWANAEKEKIQELKAAGKPFTWRLRIPKDRGTVSWIDLVRGKQSVNSALLGDFIVLREDGSATYNFASIIDDLLMNIDVVMRGEDHASNTPKQILLAETIAQLPEYKEDFQHALKNLNFAHIPIVLGKDKSKLSKRNGSKNISQFREEGYLPVSIKNSLAHLVWSPPAGKEITNIEQLLEIFNPKKLSKSPTVFDETKLNWINSKHLKLIEDSKEKIKLAKNFLSIASENKELIEKSILHLWPELTKLDEINEKISPIINPDQSVIPVDEDKKTATCWLENYQEDFNLWKKTTASTCNAKGKGLYMPLRLALSGEKHGIELIDLRNLLGAAETKKRLKNYIDR